MATLCICLAGGGGGGGGGLSQREMADSVSVGSWPANGERTVGRVKLEYGPIHG